MLSLIARTKKETRTFGSHVISCIQVPHQRSAARKESRVAGDEQVSTKAFQRECSGFATEIPRPRACGTRPIRRTSKIHRHSR
jgi:hypothetical protein